MELPNTAGNSHSPAQVLITGASGLLGSSVAEALGAWANPTLLAHSNQRPGMRAIDLATGEGMSAVGAMNWDAMVHCAAFRSPDYCEQHREEALVLNTEVAAQLARMSARRGARFIHISTDYVFDGRHPPYREGDPTRPVNVYGETKQLAERAVMDAYASAVILRIPALYGAPAPPLGSPLLDEAIVAACSQTPVTRDNSIIRFPTYTGDIAAVICFLLQKDCTGIVHASAPQQSTQFEWTCAIARLIRGDCTHILPCRTDPMRKATRPHNAHLATDRLAELGGPLPKPYDMHLPDILRKKGHPLLTDDQ